MTDEAVPWLDATELRTWTALVGMLEALPAALNAQLRSEAGLNLFEYTILVGLSDAPAWTRAFGDLSTFACGSASRMSHALGRLEGRGWIERAPHPDGGRALVVTLTDAGHEALVAIAPGHVREVRRRVLDPLTAEQVQELGEIARRLVGASNPELAAMLQEREEQE